MNSAKYHKEIDKIARNFNVFQLNKQINSLLEFNPEVLDLFARKYPAIIIFLFTIIEEERKKRLFEKLTESTVYNIIAEELRMLVLREIGKQGGGDNFDILFDFMDNFITTETVPNQLVNKTIKKALYLLFRSRESLQIDYFSYLKIIDTKELHKIIEYIIDNNIHIALGLIIYAHKSSSNHILDMLVVKNQLEILNFIPPQKLEDRINVGKTNIYAAENVLQFFPKHLQSKIQKQKLLNYKYESFYQYLRNLTLNKNNTKMDYEHYRSVVMKKVFKHLKTLDNLERQMLLTEICAQELLVKTDVEIVRSTLNTLHPMFT
jgi:hypothetical protein